MSFQWQPFYFTSRFSMVKKCMFRMKMDYLKWAQFFSVPCHRTHTSTRTSWLVGCLCLRLCVCRLPPFVCCNIYVFAFGLVCVFTTWAEMQSCLLSWSRFAFKTFWVPPVSTHHPLGYPHTCVWGAHSQDSRILSSAAYRSLRLCLQRR